MDNHEIPAETNALLTKVLGENLDDFSVTIEGENKKGEGYLSERLKLTVHNKNTGKDLHIVLKQSPYESDLISSVYKQEIYFYEKVWPAFVSLLNTVTDLKAFNPIPKVLAIDSQSEIKKIAMENLIISGYELFDKRNFFDNDHAELICKNYGKFHALSFVLSNKHPEEFSKLIKPVNENDAEVKANMGFMGQAVQNLSKLVRDNYNGEKKSEVREKLEKYVENGKQMFIKSKNYDGEYPIITHGDCWSNNFLFKYDASRKPVDMKILDYQLIQVGTPVYDVSYFFYSSASKELLDNLQIYLKIYHESISNTMKEFGLDPTVLYPFSALKKEWKQYCKFGYMMGILLWSGKLVMNPDGIVDMQEVENGVTNKTPEIDYERYHPITRDLTWHMFENDFL